MNTCFNSSMVRLGDSFATLHRLLLCGFNSSMVRLGELSTDCPKGSCHVSIPVWFDWENDQ